MNDLLHLPYETYAQILCIAVIAFLIGLAILLTGVILKCSFLKKGIPNALIIAGGSISTLGIIVIGLILLPPIIIDGNL